VYTSCVAHSQLPLPQPLFSHFLLLSSLPSMYTLSSRLEMMILAVLVSAVCGTAAASSGVEILLTASGPSLSRRSLAQSSKLISPAQAWLANAGRACLLFACFPCFVDYIPSRAEKSSSWVAFFVVLLCMAILRNRKGNDAVPCICTRG
jgi:hypothetical protein